MEERQKELLWSRAKHIAKQQLTQNGSKIDDNSARLDGLTSSIYDKLLKDTQVKEDVHKYGTEDEIKQLKESTDFEDHWDPQYMLYDFVADLEKIIGALSLSQPHIQKIAKDIHNKWENW